MTGEMAWINQDGEDSNGDVWATHAAVAKAVGGELRPFDKYQGPFIVAPHRIGNVGVRGAITFWLVAAGPMDGQVYREDTDTLSDHFDMDDEQAAAVAARSLLDY